VGDVLREGVVLAAFERGQVDDRREPVERAELLPGETDGDHARLGRLRDERESVRPRAAHGSYIAERDVIPPALRAKRPAMLRAELGLVGAHARAAAGRRSERVEVGAFAAFFAGEPDGPAYAIPARPAADKEQLAADLAALSQAFHERGLWVRVEL